MPLQMAVDHVWHGERSQVEHFPLRRETVHLSFNALHEAQQLKPGALGGLYNYALALCTAESLAGKTIDRLISRLHYLFLILCMTIPRRLVLFLLALQSLTTITPAQGQRCSRALVI